MKQLISDFKDEFGEQVGAVTKQVKLEPKKLLASAKSQIIGNAGPGNTNQGLQQLEQGAQKHSGPKAKVDPVTGKPPPTKPMLRNLQQEIRELDTLKKQKLKQQLLAELEKQRMKESGEEGEEVTLPGAGPAMPREKKPKLDPGAVSRMMRNAKSTGEARGGDLVG